MSRCPPGWSSWIQEELSTPGAGPSGPRYINNEQELKIEPADAHVARSRKGLYVPQNMTGHVQPFPAHMHFRLHDTIPHFSAVFAHRAPPFATPLLPIPAPFTLPTWASISSPGTTPRYRQEHAPVLTSTPIPVMATGPLSPAPEEHPTSAAPTAARTAVAPTTPITPTALIAPALDTAPDAMSIPRVTPTDAQRSTYSASEGAVKPFKGPLVDMGRTIVMARLDPRWDPSVFRRETRKRAVEAEDQPRLKRARVEEGPEETIAEASLMIDMRADEGGSGTVMEREIGSRAGSKRSEETWPLESGFRCIAPKPAPRSVKAAGGLRRMSVVIPQVYGNALNENNRRSTTSTHEVDNPAGEPVVEPVPLSSGGPSTSTPADDQEEADEPQDEEDHDEGQHQLGEQTSLSASQREAAVVIDEKIYGRDPLRCLACDNISFARKYDRRRHVVTIHYLKKVPCDWCDMFFYARRDGITRHKDENCPARDFEDRHTNPMRWFMAWLNGPSGWR